MTVKQISLITMKSGQKANLPDSLDEAEICFTTDTGEIFIGAPNFPAVQYRSDQSASTNGQGISPFRNIKVLTEFDVTKTITGDFYTQEALDRTVVPLTSSPYKIYTFEPGVNSIIASYSLYDGQNVNLVGELFISVFEGDAMVCNAGQQVDGIQFISKLNSSNEIELYSVNETDSIYTMYISAKCWKSNVAEWDGTKGNGIKPFCLNMKDEDDGLPSIAICTDVKLSDLSNNQFLKYNSTDNKWENTTINYSDITGTPPVAPPSIATCTDVTLSNLANKNFLQFNSTDNKWENVSISYSDITGTIPASGEEYLKNLKDVKLSVLSDNQFLKYSAADDMWENTTINYSDIAGTPPATPVAIADCSDVKLTNLSDDQVLQYNATDKMWENTTASFPASWTIDKNVIATGSTYDDAAKTSSTLVQVTSSEGFTDTIVAGTSTPSNYYHYIGTYLKSGQTITSTQVYPTGGSGSGAVLFQSNSSVTVELAKTTSSIFSQTFSISVLGSYWQIYSCIYVPNIPNWSGWGYEYTAQNVYYQVTGITLVSGSTTAYNVTELTPVYRDNSGNYHKITYSDIPNIAGKIYSPPNSAEKLFPINSSVSEYSTKGDDIYPNNTFISNGFMLFEYATGWSDDTVNNINWGGQNYAVGDVLTCGVDGTFTVTKVSTVPNRGIRLSDQPVGSMVIVKNETENKPINVYGFNATDSINGSTVYTIPDSTYKNYETKFIKTDSTTWQVF